jgi:hypothetical protein
MYYDMTSPVSMYLIYGIIKRKKERKKEAAMMVLLMGGVYEVSIQIARGGMTYIQCFMMTGSEIQIMLRLIPQQFENLQCWYCWWERFRKNDIEMALHVIKYITSIINIGSGIQKF